MAPRIAHRHRHHYPPTPPTTTTTTTVLTTPSSTARLVVDNVDDDDCKNTKANEIVQQHQQQQQQQQRQNQQRQKKTTTMTDANARGEEFERVESSMLLFQESGDNDDVMTMFHSSSSSSSSFASSLQIHSKKCDDVSPKISNNNNKNNDSGGKNNDKSLDVYAQLDEFEQLLDIELENLEKLGFLESNKVKSGSRVRLTNNNDASIRRTSSTRYRGGGEEANENYCDSDCCESSTDEDVDHVNDDDNSESDADEEEKLTLLPPPSSWFLRLDDDIGDGGGGVAFNMNTSCSASLHPDDDDDDDPNMEKQCNTDLAASTTTTITDHPTTTNTNIKTITPASASQFEKMLAQITSLTYAPTTTLAVTTSLLTSLISQTNIPSILHEISSSIISRGVHKLRLEYTNFQSHIGPNRYKRASDIGNANGRGYYCPEHHANILSLFPSLSTSSSKPIPQFVVYRYPPAASLEARRIRRESDDDHDDDDDKNAVRNGDIIHDDNLENVDNCITSATDKSRNNDKNEKSIRDDHHPDWNMQTWDGTEVRFTSLSWIERQLVREWRTYEWNKDEDDDQEDENMLKKDDDDDCLEKNNGSSGLTIDDNECGIYSHSDAKRDNVVDDDKNTEDPFDIEKDELFYSRARTMAPRALPRPMWEKATSCYTCRRTFGHALHRHHCRRCGHSYCRAHSNLWHRLPHLGYDVDVPERVCRNCKSILDDRDLEERVSWRLARCRDLLKRELTPYFETGMDSVEDVAYRLTRLAITFARAIPLGAQAYVAVETAEVLRKHGLKGVYGLLLRKEFLAAADLLCRVLGINKTNWPLSVHELSAAIFYALAQHRALRGLRPDGEELIHSLRPTNDRSNGVIFDNEVSANISSTEGRCVMNIVREDNKLEDDFDATDTITLAEPSQKFLVEEVSESVLDETDVYDPLSEKVIDILAMTNSNRWVSRDRCKTENTHMSSGIDGGAINGGNACLGAMTTAQSTSSCSKLPFEPVCEHVPDTLISSLLFYAPLALEFIYAECEVDMQLLGAQQGWRLVFASLDQNYHHSHTRNKESTCLEGDDHFSDRPAAALFAHDEHKIACLSIRGTATIQDVVTDIRATPVPFPQMEEDHGGCGRNSSLNDGNEWTSVFRGSGLALCGMAGAAANLFRETADPLLYLALNGYKIRIVGHSLGGGVAALLGILLLRHFEKQGVEAMRCKSSSNVRPIDDGGFVHVYSYGTPSCVDAKLADHPLTLALCTSVVLHDDVVPRLTPTSVRGLLKHLLYIRETWVKTHLSDDLNAITERALTAWPSRLRGSFTLLKKKGVASAKRLKKSCKKRIQGEISNSIPVVNECNQHDVVWSNKTLSVPNKLPTCQEIELRREGSKVGSNDGLDVEGDLFFDTNGDPLNESDDESSAGGQHQISSDGRNDSEWVPFDEPPMEVHNDMNSLTEPIEKPSSDDAYPQMLEEMPLPRMYIPGKIVHVYSHRGGYKAAFVPRKFRSLRRVSMAGNMLSDHMASRYYEGLLEVQAIRASPKDLPPWVGFADDCTCSCCASLFTWASTSHTEAQAARDKHNCRACGCLVCGPCSKRRIPIPTVGISSPVRVCDRCYNGWGSLHEHIEADGTTDINFYTQHTKRGVNKPIPRRSVVVDELASRIPSISS